MSEVDADFDYQGEYYGTLPTAGGGPSAVVGLQVIARGDGAFDAVEYPGGLPGVGWFSGEKAWLRGRIEGSNVRLAGVNHSYIVAKNAAWCIDDRAPMPTWINKVHRISRTMGVLPPSNAVVLFGGGNTDRLVNAKVTSDGLLEQGTSTRDAFRDYFLHLEFQLSYMPYARGQGRSNSGVYLQSSYEVQILDSFGLEGLSNECGGLYHYRKPDVNMCLPPLVWQTYDIAFRAPRYNGFNQKISNARITVWHNGYAIHNDVEISRKTGGGREEAPWPLLPIVLQDHHNPVRFRNVWMIDSSPPVDWAVGALVPPQRTWVGAPLWAIQPQWPGAAGLPTHNDYWNW